MGVKFGRAYEHIVDDLVEAILSTGECHEWFEMEPEQWQGLEQAEQVECVKTLADDIFYGLGAEATMMMGRCQFIYDAAKHCIKVEMTATNAYSTAKSHTITLI